VKVSQGSVIAAVATAFMLVAAVPASACNGKGNCENAPGQNKFHGAPGPVIGAGAPALAIGIGYGVYWIRKRRRRTG